MSMGIVDTLMVGSLGPAAIGATGMSSAVFTRWRSSAWVDAGHRRAGVAGVRRARIEECVRWLHQGIALRSWRRRW